MDQLIRIIQPNDGYTFPELGTLSCKLASDLTGNSYTVLELRLQPGQGSQLHVHQFEEEIVLVLHGTCTIGNREQSWKLETGGLAIFPKQTVHFFRNTGSEECTLLITAIPGGLDRYFAALSNAIVQQDVQAISAINTQYGITFVE